MNQIIHYFFKGDNRQADGNIITQEDPTGKACGKIIENLDTEYERFYIKTGRGQLFNPYDNDHLKARRGTFQYRQVNRACFTYYCKFLRNASQQYKSHAEGEL